MKMPRVIEFLLSPASEVAVQLLGAPGHLSLQHSSAIRSLLRTDKTKPS